MIALKPDVLLLDEPTAGFTPREIASFLAVVERCATYLDATIVIIDHDIHVMRDLVGRLYVLAAGQVIAEGPPVRARDRRRRPRRLHRRRLNIPAIERNVARASRATWRKRAREATTVPGAARPRQTPSPAQTA